MNDKKVSEFSGRRPGAPGTVPAQEQPKPDQRPGNFDRNPCGECWHFKPNPRAGLDAGFCMFGPPTPHPVQMQGGRAGNILARPVVTTKTEGCDQWDDESEFVEGEGEPEPAQLAAGGSD